MIITAYVIIRFIAIEAVEGKEDLSFVISM